MSSPVSIQPFDGQSVCLFCGSSDLSDPAYTAAARAFGEQTARAGWRLVYGGGGVGLMGASARPGTYLTPPCLVVVRCPSGCR